MQIGRRRQDSVASLRIALLANDHPIGRIEGERAWTRGDQQGRGVLDQALDRRHSRFAGGVEESREQFAVAAKVVPCPILDQVGRVFAPTIGPQHVADRRRARPAHGSPAAVVCVRELAAERVDAVVGGADARVAADAKQGLLDGLRAQLAVDVLDEALVDPAHAIVGAPLEVADDLADAIGEVAPLLAVLARGLVEIRIAEPAPLSCIAELLHPRGHRDRALGADVEIADAVEDLGADREEPSRELDLAGVLAHAGRADPAHRLAFQRGPAIVHARRDPELAIAVEVDAELRLIGRVDRHVGARDQGLEDRQIDRIDLEVVLARDVAAKLDRQANQRVAGRTAVARKEGPGQGSKRVAAPARARALGRMVPALGVELEPCIGDVAIPGSIGVGVPTRRKIGEPIREHELVGLAVIGAAHIGQQLGLVDVRQRCASIGDEVGPAVGQRRSGEIVGGLNLTIADEIRPSGVVVADEARVVDAAARVARVDVALRRNVGARVRRQANAQVLLGLGRLGGDFGLGFGFGDRRGRGVAAREQRASQSEGEGASEAMHRGPAKRGSEERRRK